MSKAMRAYNAADPQRNRDKANAWRAANLDRARVVGRKRRERNIERERERTAKWKRENPHKVYEGVRKRRAQKVGGDSRIVTERDWLRLVLPACGPCNGSKGTKLLVEWRRPT